MTDTVVCTSTMSPVLKQLGFVGWNLFRMCVGRYVELDGELNVYSPILFLSLPAYEGIV